MTPAELRTDVVILSCAISAGIHGALVPDHFEEGTGAGLGFVAATVLLAVLAIVLTHTVDGLALFTKAVEAVGLVLAASLLRRPSLTLEQPKGTLA